MNREFIRERLVPVLVVITTLILAGIAVFTAIKLYQLRQEQITPTTPEKSKAAPSAPQACSVLAFTLASTPPSASPSSSPTGSPTATPSHTPTPTPTKSATPTGSATPTPSTTASATPTPTSTGTPGVTPTNAPGLPDSGIEAPTILGIIIGVIAIVGSILLAI